MIELIIQRLSKNRLQNEDGFSWINELILPQESFSPCEVY